MEHDRRGLRDIPDALANAISRNQRIDDTNFTAAELEAIGESFVNSPLTVIQTEDLQPDFEGEVTAGATFDLGRFNFGLVGVGGYDSSWRSRTADRMVFVGANMGSDLVSRSTAWDVVANGFGSASIGWDENEITLTGLLVRSSTKYAQISQGFDENLPNADVYKEATAWYERQLASLQLAGEHRFGALDIDWRIATAESRGALTQHRLCVARQRLGGDLLRLKQHVVLVPDR